MECATLSVVEVARFLGIGRNAAYEAVRTGQIPSIRIGGRIVVPKVALEHMLNEAGSMESKITYHPEQ